MNGGASQADRILTATFKERRAQPDLAAMLLKANTAYCEAEIRRALYRGDDHHLDDLDMAAIGAAKAAKAALRAAGIDPDILREALQ